MQPACPHGAAPCPIPRRTHRCGAAPRPVACTAVLRLVPHAPLPVLLPVPQDLYERFMELVNGQPVRPAWVDVAMGRQLEMPRTGGCATLFTFDELCNRPLGAGGAGRVGKGSGRFVWGGKGVGGLGGGSADRQAGRQAEQAAHLTPIGCPPPIDPGPPLFPSSLFFLLLPPSAHLHRVSPPTCVPCPCAIHPPHPHVSLIPAPAADYIALANAKHTVALSGVPVFTAANRQTAYRFVTLVDVLYEHRWGSGGVGGGVFVCFRSRARERDREGEIERERERDPSLPRAAPSPLRSAPVPPLYPPAGCASCAPPRPCPSSCLRT